jgi:hypothetical protein
VPESDPPARPALGNWRGTYLPHGWTAAPKSIDMIESSVRSLESADITDQLLNIGYLDTEGRLQPADYQGLGRWIEVSRATAPDQRIIAWISGSALRHVDRPALHPAIVATIGRLVHTAGLDGVLLDFEPFRDNDAQLLGLLDSLRAELPETWIGITAPAVSGMWSDAFIGAVSARVEAVSPMLYDTELRSSAEYVDAMCAELVRYGAAVNDRAVLIPSLPAYAASPEHDPGVENVANAFRAVDCAGRAGWPSRGAALYWWWQATPEDVHAWSAAVR